MRNWCATVAMSALLAVPLCAQDKQSGPNENETAQPSPAKVANRAPAPRSGWAIAGPVRTTPFATPATPPAKGKSNDEGDLGMAKPPVQLWVGYIYTGYGPGEPFDRFHSQGGGGELEVGLSKWMGLVVEIGAGRFSRNDLSSIAQSDTLGSYLFGPRLNIRRWNRVVPFAEFLIGGARSGEAFTGTPSSGHSSFAIAPGGGVDAIFAPWFGWRIFKVDYFMTNFSGPAVGGNARQDNWRFMTGPVLRIGVTKPPPPPPPNRAPVASCSASPSSMYAGSGDTAAIHVSASDADNDPLTYAYTATGGTVDGSGPDARWNSAGLGVGAYTVNTKVDDGKGGTATCAADIKVEERPNRPPTLSCSAERSPILPGDRTKITATASDPDNDNLTYSWKATGGQVAGSGATVDFDASGLQPGSYTVTGRVDDGRGGAADCSTTVDVQAPPAPPQASKIGECSYKAGITRVDNLCKRIGDDVALRLKNEPNGKAVIVGFADPKEKGAAKAAGTRADLFKKYLGEKGIDASRISTRTGEAQKGADKENRRIDIIFVPEGATY